MIDEARPGGCERNGGANQSAVPGAVLYLIDSLKCFGIIRAALSHLKSVHDFPHNPKVAGSNPAPATIQDQQLTLIHQAQLQIEVAPESRLVALQCHISVGFGSSLIPTSLDVIRQWLVFDREVRKRRFLTDQNSSIV
jgi:hypothetical protein